MIIYEDYLDVDVVVTADRAVTAVKLGVKNGEVSEGQVYGESSERVMGNVSADETEVTFDLFRATPQVALMNSVSGVTVQDDLFVHVMYADAQDEWVLVYNGSFDGRESQEIPAAPDGESVSATLPEGAEGAYLQILMEHQAIMQAQLPWWTGDLWENGVSFVDITGDGIPEMF